MHSNLSNQTKSPQSWKKKKGIKRLSLSKKRTGHKQKKNKKSLKEIFSKRNIIKKTILLGLLCILVGFIYVLILSRDIPRPDKLMDREVAESTRIYDRTGETILYQIHGLEKRTLVGLNEIPQHVREATIAIEDKNFYTHNGFSMWAIFRTAITNVFLGKKAGGSTLTQQFVKNAILTSEKKYSRKIKELILAYKIEQKFNKDEILTMYFNEIPYGSNAYGVEAASTYYFGKHVEEISLAEAAILASLPQGPSYYSPYGPNKEALIGRQQYILDLMVEQEFITEEEAVIAKNTELVFKEKTNNILAPHFVMHIKEMLAEKYGEKTIEQEGLKIITTLDLYKQEIAEEVITEKAEINAEKYNASNASLVSIDPKTGQILAMVGSKDYFDDEIDGQFNVALAPRQPGSSFKPMVYTAGWSKGYRPATKVFDVVTNFSNNPDKPYEPHNYDNTEHGPVSLRTALAGSLNIPAVKVLYLVGPNNVLKLAKDLGYTTLTDGDRYGLSLVLGGGEVKLLEHTNAYSAFAREGTIHEPVFILKIEDKDGKVLEEWEETKGKTVLDSNIARITNDVLSDNNARAYAFGENNLLTLPERPVAAKTGTTNDYRDAWTIGYTPSIVTGVWVGNNDNSAMARGAGGSTVAAPIWNSYMRKVLGNTPVESFNKPDLPTSPKPIIDGIGFAEKKIKIDKFSGLLATEQTPIEAIEEKTFLELHSILYYVKKEDPLGLAPKDSSKDSQFEQWEARIQEWAEEKKEEDPTFIGGEPPTESDNLHIPENKPTVTISGITNNIEVNEPRIPISIQATAPRGIHKAEYYINGNLFDATTSFPFSMNRPLNILDNGSYNLKISICDDVNNCTERTYKINIKILDNFKRVNKVNISWASPANNAELENSTVKLKVNVVNPDTIAKIDFYYIGENSNPQLINTRQAVDNTLIEINWDTKQPEDQEETYQVYAVASSWRGTTRETDKITFNIKN